RRTRQLELQIERPPVAFVDNRALAMRADEELADFFHRLLCGGQTDAAKTRRGQRLQALERQRQVRAAAAADDRVNFVDDDRTDGAQRLAAALRGQQQIERFRCRDQNVRRRPENLRAFRCCRVAGADRGGDLRRVDAGRFGELLNAAARNREVLVHIRAQRLERRYVDNP